MAVVDEPSPRPTRFCAPGSNPVELPITCVLTRFGLRSIWQLWPTFQDYRRIVRQARAAQTPGLLRSAFLIENLRTCYTLSIWSGPGAIPQFGTNVPEHVMAGNRCMRRVVFHPGRGPEIWSAKWRLSSVSHNLCWPGFDLRGLIIAIQQNARAEPVAADGASNGRVHS